jgi:hypothetical protein
VGCSEAGCEEGRLRHARIQMEETSAWVSALRPMVMKHKAAPLTRDVVSRCQDERLIVFRPIAGKLLLRPGGIPSLCRERSGSSARIGCCCSCSLLRCGPAQWASIDRPDAAVRRGTPTVGTDSRGRRPYSVVVEPDLDYPVALVGFLRPRCVDSCDFARAA